MGYLLTSRGLACPKVKGSCCWRGKERGGRQESDHAVWKDGVDSIRTGESWRY